MSSQIFISYRRDDSSASAGRLYDRLLVRLPNNHIFIDVDLDPGIDFVAAIEGSVGSCDVLIAVIGKRWLLSSDEEGKRRLDNTEDFVRVEIATALKRNIRVIPILVDGASMPRSNDLPDDLKPLARRNALEVSHNRFNADLGRLVVAIEAVLKKAEAEGPERLRGQGRENEGEHKLESKPLEAIEREQSEAPHRQEDAEAAFDRGNAYYEKNEYDNAITGYTDAICLNPDYPEAFNRRGEAYNHKKDYDKAISDYTEAIRLNLNFDWAYNNRGYAYYEKKEYDKAVSEYTEAIRLDPNSDVFYNNRGHAYYEKKEYDRAISDFTEAIRLNPNNAPAYGNRGHIFCEKKEYDKAIRDCTEAIRLDRNSGEFYNGRGNAYYAKDEYDKAISDYTEAVRLKPNFDTAYRNRGKVYESQGKFGKAKADFAKADELERAGQ
jgi:tetratricopeptide (TPR) repeat protein